MDKESIIREICSAIPIICPNCETRVPDYRIDLKGIRKGVWYLGVICGGCDASYTIIVDTHLPLVKTAIRLVCGDRKLSEEIRLRGSGEIPPFYEKELPRLLEEWWKNEPTKGPSSPQTAV